jgi:serine/threonine protein kinase
MALRTLGMLHARGWVHGDVNPGNLLIDEKRLFLIDFGACRRVGESVVDMWPMGRHRYMAPEHLYVRRRRRFEPSLDLHQVACLILHMLSGEEPFRAATRREDYATEYLRNLRVWMERPAVVKLKQYRHLWRQAVAPADLWPILRNALEPNARLRLADASAMATLLEKLGND